jgi:hypothetical protein
MPQPFRYDLGSMCEFPQLKSGLQAQDIRTSGMRSAFQKHIPYVSVPYAIVAIPLQRA